jgi:short-subunit dehydrogenase involved in D-alanine esterification of teichoic acids
VVQLTRQLLERDNKVAVGVRNTKSEDLLKLQQRHEGKLTVLMMDAASSNSIHDWVADVAKEMKNVDVRPLFPTCLATSFPV